MDLSHPCKQTSRTLRFPMLQGQTFSVAVALDRPSAIAIENMPRASFQEGFPEGFKPYEPFKTDLRVMFF